MKKLPFFAFACLLAISVSSLNFKSDSRGDCDYDLEYLKDAGAHEKYNLKCKSKNNSYDHTVWLRIETKKWEYNNKVFDTKSELAKYVCDCD